MMPGKRYIGVAHVRRTGKYECHIWHRGVGRQLYVGMFYTAEEAARAYDAHRIAIDASLGCVTEQSKLNFKVTDGRTERSRFLKLRAHAMAARGGPQEGEFCAELRDMLFRGGIEGGELVAHRA